LGQRSFTTSLQNQDGVSKRGFRNPSGIAVNQISGRVYVADSGNHRVLSWPSANSFVNGADADIALGQRNLHVVQRNGNEVVGANTLATPGGLFLDANGALWVADSGNHRVLRFDAPHATDISASLVLGQANFLGSASNQGGVRAANTLSTPTAIALRGSTLAIADTDNQRVLLYTAPFSNGMGASTVLGQADFASGVLNSGGLTRGLNFPRGVAFDNVGRLFVGDASNHRIVAAMAPYANHQVFSLVLGQPGFATNASATTATGLNGPRQLAIDRDGFMYVADHTNNRILVYGGALANGAAALFVLGQPDFMTSTGVTSRTRIDRPIAVAVDPDRNLYFAALDDDRAGRFNTPIMGLPRLFFPIGSNAATAAALGW
jgi:sugar lactone lactonase YvrE